MKHATRWVKSNHGAIVEIGGLPTPTELGKAMLRLDLNERNQRDATVEGEWGFAAIRYDWLAKAKALLHVLRKQRRMAVRVTNLRKSFRKQRRK